MSFLPALSRLERQALLVGLSDARNNRRISKPGRQSRLQLLARLIFGTEGFATLADPHLEALRDLAMRHGGPSSRSQGDAPRSEEHTSELQSLMRISYAVFCLKKKNTTYKNTNNPLNTHTRQQRTKHT